MLIIIDAKLNFVKRYPVWHLTKILISELEMLLSMLKKADLHEFRFVIKGLFFIIATFCFGKTVLRA